MNKVGHLGIPGWLDDEMPGGGLLKYQSGKGSLEIADDSYNMELGKAAMRLSRATTSPLIFVLRERLLA
jgi:hypothetical protein